MKKIAIASMLAIAAMTASAVEVGVTTTEGFQGGHTFGQGLTVGETFGGFGVTAGWTRFTRPEGQDDQTRTSIVVDKTVYNLGPVGFAGRVGVAHLDNATSLDGNAATVGVGAKYAVTKQISLNVALDKQYGQGKVSQFDGNQLTAGLTFGF
jgi:opacity protein-like surface antigen